MKIVEAMQLKEDKKEEPKLKGLLYDLYMCALKNQDRKSNGRNYTDFEPLRKLCTLLYLLSGVQSYELFAANLIIPSLSTVKASLSSSEVIKEGEFRFKALKKYLQRRGSPLVVFLSEDGTRINGRILYHSSTNQLVGFVLGLDSNGVPIGASYPATSAKVMAKYFREAEISNNAYVIMAQPLSSGDAPFCLSIFGTNNRFKSSDVLKRWTWMSAEAAKEGIRIAGFAADGDPKLMAAMRSKIFVASPRSPWNWFHANLVSAQVCYYILSMF